MNADLSKTQYTSCPVCASPIKQWRVKKVIGEDFRIDKCESCGFSFVNPRPSFNFLMDYYSLVGHKTEKVTLEELLLQEKKYPNSTVDAKRIIKTIKSLIHYGSCGKLLDVGCGYGFFSREALKAGFEVSALELAENEKTITKKLTGLSPIACSFETFEYNYKPFQTVLMSQTLEHALDVNLWINKAHDLLENDGIVAIALPNFGSIFRLIMQENEPFICPPAHLNFFTVNSLSKLLSRHGFHVERIQCVSRISTTTLAKRIPIIFQRLFPLFKVFIAVALKFFDAFHLGMIITVYARKRSD